MSPKSPMHDDDLAQLQDAAEQWQSTVRRLDPRSLSDAEAIAALKVLTQTERVCAAARTVVARRLERSKVWQGQGHRSAAHWLASQTGVSVGQAVGVLETGRSLEHLGATADAFACGEPSETKVREVAAAAATNPQSEGELLQAARTSTVPALRERCRRVKATAADEIEVYERIRKSRYLRHWTDVEGAFRMEARLTADDGARVLVGLEPYRERIFKEARKAGRREPSEAYAADALVAMAGDTGGTGTGTKGPRATVHIRVDHSALVRGYAEDGEVCEIPGIGPIPVPAARRMANDAFLKVLLTDGTDIKAVAHVGRTIPAKLRTALEARDPTCVVQGCDVRHGLEFDHIVSFAEGGLTTEENLARLCSWHHYLKTHMGYRLIGGHGNWILIGPDPPT